jgi:hypothetical protein
MLLLLFCGTGAWTQSLHLESLRQPFFMMGFFEIVLQTICPGLAILLVSASWVARITGVSHWCPAYAMIFNGYLVGQLSSTILMQSPLIRNRLIKLCILVLIHLLLLQRILASTLCVAPQLFLYEFIEVDSLDGRRDSLYGFWKSVTLYRRIVTNGWTMHACLSLPPPPSHAQVGNYHWNEINLSESY